MDIDAKRLRIRQNVAAVRASIETACRRANRPAADVLLVAATKYVDSPAMQLLMEAGIRDFGENRVQQLQQRVAELGTSFACLGATASGPSPRWHMIGHLQRNKVKPLLGCAHIVHSIDSARLAHEVEKHAADLGATVDVLVEVNISGEASKEGIAAADAAALVRELVQLPHLRACGLMTMAPLGESAEAARPTFAGLRRLLASLHEEGIAGAELRHLSMGMSHDFEVAIEEGATIVRVGSRLFEGLIE